MITIILDVAALTKAFQLIYAMSPLISRPKVNFLYLKEFPKCGEVQVITCLLFFPNTFWD